MIEVEVKAKVNGFEEVKKNLDEIGALNIGSEHQEDTYFNAPHRDFAKTDEALRIRKIPAGEEVKIFITYKGAKIDESSKTRKEYEVEVENADITRQIFESLSFKPVETVIKDREIYELDEFIITLDTVFNVGTYMEIEKDLIEGQDFDKTLEDIFKLYNRLGITRGFERRSYLELLGI
ncbi:class IV adenylate cyclase [Methanobacterium alcaliphilum]|uniref:class IV adenylate cyclase n=1 Tax=Methanobacterium alcaliphilum TaxID=392018 RepID=UPI00200A9ECE|nr:class IV adenylate cyclase [Methanobacterium alcaliphilum]MCK9152437.1 class IV adenylate cyclase [Methanobacterium alcaliphilum]